jgi:hypothetical protein
VWMRPKSRVFRTQLPPEEAYQVVAKIGPLTGWKVLSQDAAQRVTRFNTGFSMKAFNGQDVTIQVASRSAQRQSEVHVLVEHARRGLGAVAVTNWGETASVFRIVSAFLEVQLRDREFDSSARATADARSQPKGDTPRAKPHPTTPDFIEHRGIRVVLSADPFEVLGLTSSAGLDLVRSRHKEILRRLHPDANPGLDGPTLRRLDEATRYLNAALDDIEDAKT